MHVPTSNGEARYWGWVVRFELERAVSKYVLPVGCTMYANDIMTKFVNRGSRVIPPSKYI